MEYFTILIYSIIISGAIFFGCQAEARSSYLSVLIIILILGVFSGIRSPVVGTDTEGYYQYIQSFGIYTSIDEPGFRVITQILMKIFTSANLVIFFYAIIINALMVNAFWNFRYLVNFKYSVLVYVIEFYFLTFSGIRQWLAISIVTFALWYLYNKKIYRFIVLVAIAFSIHFSAIITIGFLPIFFVVYKDYFLRNKYKRILFFILIFPAIIIVIYLIIKYLAQDVYKYYISNLNSMRTNMGLGLMQFVNLLLISSFEAIRMINFKNSSILKDNSVRILVSDIKQKRFLYLTEIFFLVMILISFLGYYYNNISRIGWYLAPFSIFFMGLTLASKVKLHIFCKVQVVVILIYRYLLLFYNGGNNLIPYSTFWMQ